MEDRRPTMVLLQVDHQRRDVAAGLAAVGGIDGLARAIASSPAWPAEASLVVRRDPSPAMGVVGWLEPAQRERLAVLQALLDHALPRTMVLGYGDVETAVERLAEAIVARFGWFAARRLAYRAIPRGGHVVLGLLSYALGLDQRRLDATPDPGDVTVFVDDVALSGRRFAMALASSEAATPVMLFTLFAAPEMREAIERHPRVMACLSAYDLRDDARQRRRQQYDAWRERWRELDPDAFWRGQPQHVCFPWNEPDVAFWNDATGRLEGGWRLVPPELCAKHRGVSSRVEARVQHVLHAPEKPVRLGDDVLAARFDDAVVVARPSWRDALALDGSAADMWEALLDHGTVHGAVEALTRRYDVAEGELAADVQAFVTALEDVGALRTNREAADWVTRLSDDDPG